MCHAGPLSAGEGSFVDGVRQGASGSQGREKVVCFLSGIFIPVLEDFCGGYKTRENVYGESSPLHGRQEIPKMFSLFPSILPKKRLYFLFQCL